MKNLFFIFYFLFFLPELFSSDWQLKNINYLVENDADARKDEAYSYGSKINLLYLIDDLNNSTKSSYISFAYANQIYTPKDLNNSELINCDRPYAGYSYFQAGYHQSNDYRLKSFIVQLGIVGPSSKMMGLQKYIHEQIGSPVPKGWGNQLSDELTLQLNYAEQQYYELNDIFDLDSILVTNNGFDFGNVSTKIYTSFLYRYGFNIPRDYGVSSINNNTYSKLPLNSKKSYQKGWGFHINIDSRINFILKNIFLDGNSFKESHSVNKNMFVFNATYGFSLSYNEFSIDYIRTHTTKEYSTQDDVYSYGSLQFSYHF